MAIDRWIDVLAAAAHTPRIALIRHLRTRAHLGRAIAALIVESCEAHARRLYADGQLPPSGNDLDSRVTRAYWLRLDAARVATECEQAEATDALLAQWKAEQGTP